MSLQCAYELFFNLAKGAVRRAISRNYYYVIFTAKARPGPTKNLSHDPFDSVPAY